MELTRTLPPVEELLAHASWLGGLARRLVDDAAEADDLVQEAITAALVRRPSSTRSLRPWLASVLRKRAAFRRRSDRHRRARELSREVPDPVPSGEELTSRAETQHRLAELVLGLDGSLRTVLLLHYYEGLSLAEIARRTEEPEATVRGRHRRGLAELRAQLDSEFEDGRAWCVLLLPLASGEIGVGATGSLFKALAPGRVLGNPMMKIGILAVVLAATFVTYWNWDELEPPSTGGTVAAATVSGQQSASPGEGADRALRTGAPDGREPRRVAVDAAAPAKSRGSVEGRVVDPRGEAVPEYAVEIVREGREPEIVWTDREGNFESGRTYSAGPILLRFLDHPRLDRAWRYEGAWHVWRLVEKERLEWTPGQPPSVYEQRVGPSWTLDLQAPPEVLAGECVAELRAGEPIDPSWSTPAPVREGTPPWVRFHSTCSGETVRSLTVRSRDGTWSGSSELDLPASGPVRIDLVSRAALNVRLPGGWPESEFTPNLVLESLDGEYRSKRIDRDGRGVPPVFHFGGLEPREYRVVFRVHGYEEPDVTLHLLSGECRTIDIRVHPAFGFVRGELRSRTGQYKGQGTVNLLGLDNEGIVLLNNFRDGRSWIRRGDTWVSPFAIEAVPAGRYRVRASEFDSYFRWTPDPLIVVVPAEELVLVCCDDEPAREVILQVVDEESGEDLPEGRGSIQVGSRRRGFLVRDGIVRLADVPLDAPLRWCVRADGHAPAWGGNADLKEGASTATAEIRLRGGWGDRVRVLDDETGHPLAGVILLADGEEVGVTDESGRVELYLARKPAQIRYVREEWSAAREPTGGNVVLATGLPIGTKLEHVVRLAPVPW